MEEEVGEKCRINRFVTISSDEESKGKMSIFRSIGHWPAVDSSHKILTVSGGEAVTSPTAAGQTGWLVRRRLPKKEENQLLSGTVFIFGTWIGKWVDDPHVVVDLVAV